MRFNIIIENSETIPFRIFSLEKEYLYMAFFKTVLLDRYNILSASQRIK